MYRKLIWMVLIVVGLTACGGTARPGDATPESTPGAEFALKSFAETYLGIAVNPLYAGDATAAVNTLIKQMPAEVQKLLNAPSMATQSYWGLLPNGVAQVSTGECDLDDSPVCPEPGSIADIEIKLRTATLGTYAFRRNTALPADAPSALALLQQEFPKLVGYTFKPVESADLSGYHFYVTEAAIAASELQPRIAAKGIVVGVMSAGGQTVVYAAVGLGDFVPALPWIP